MNSKRFYNFLAKIRLPKDSEKELLKILREADVGICEACESLCPLVEHHWFGDYLNDKDASLQKRWICSKCNSRLTSRNFYGNIGNGDHILPSWDIQKLFIKLDYHYNNPQNCSNPSKPFIEYLEEQKEKISKRLASQKNLTKTMRLIKATIF